MGQNVAACWRRSPEMIREDDPFFDCDEGGIAHDPLFRRALPSCAVKKVASTPRRKCRLPSPKLTEEDQQALVELQEHFMVEPEPTVSEYEREDQRSRFIRWLRSEAWNVEATISALHRHAAWWEEYKMDAFTEDDEFDETGPLFVCGQDRCGRPTLIFRPCMLQSASQEESLHMARRCIFTVQRCIERMPCGVTQHTVLVDASGVSQRNFDFPFAQEVISVLASHFPCRLNRVVVINIHWSMAVAWRAFSTLVKPETKAKICFYASEFQDELLHVLGEDHPYFKYLKDIQGMSTADAAAVPLPMRSPYVPRWRDAVAGTVEDSDSEPSEPSELSDLDLRAHECPSPESTAATDSDVERGSFTGSRVSTAAKEKDVCLEESPVCMQKVRVAWS
eukprot:gnl/TRDRNA2_/TRDRNA2_165512_c0_seq7.p1 gnl/TRDRNA2_/TRDRNA2_165512_c0~~gnl/TRDRNA2_/TRDRNA2_165512_c0_seq7.p1  ORF type:complete len:393 (+),score=75.73 gnl/TRDRNA2_/TRDRNA2_165512_c0_seq7:59-1237(+)